MPKLEQGNPDHLRRGDFIRRTDTGQRATCVSASDRTVRAQQRDGTESIWPRSLVKRVVEER
jgi:hypothetical protein